MSFQGSFRRHTSAICTTIIALSYGSGECRTSELISTDSVVPLLPIRRWLAARTRSVPYSMSLGKRMRVSVAKTKALVSAMNSSQCTLQVSRTPLTQMPCCLWLENGFTLHEWMVMMVGTMEHWTLRSSPNSLRAIGAKKKTFILKGNAIELTLSTGCGHAGALSEKIFSQMNWAQGWDFFFYAWYLLYQSILSNHWVTEM